MIKRTSITVDSDVRSSVKAFPDGSYIKAYMAAMQLPIDLQLIAMGNTEVSAKYSTEQMKQDEHWQIICDLVQIINECDCHRMTSSIFNFERKVPSVRVQLYQESGRQLADVTMLFELDGRIVAVTCPEHVALERRKAYG